MCLSNKLPLLSESTIATFNLVGGQCAVTRTKVYKICLSNMQGRRHQVGAIGMDNLFVISPGPEKEYLANRFPDVNPCA